MADVMRISRSRGALSGALLILLGAWGALIPFVGPYFNYAYKPARPWVPTSGRLWLDVLPGACALAGGLVVFISRLRPVAILGAWVAAIGGAWFAVGGLLAPLFPGGGPDLGSPVGDRAARAVEQLGFFGGLGVVVMFVAGVAIGRLSVISAKDARYLASRPIGDPDGDPGRDAAGKSEPAPSAADQPADAAPPRLPAPGVIRASRSSTPTRPL